MHLQIFPKEFLEMQEEIQNHDDLLIALLQLPAGADFGEKFARIAAHCGMVLDGYYDNDQVVFLCTEVTRKLKAMRTLRGRDYVDEQEENRRKE